MSHFQKSDIFCHNKPPRIHLLTVGLDEKPLMQWGSSRHCRRERRIFKPTITNYQGFQVLFHVILYSIVRPHHTLRAPWYITLRRSVQELNLASFLVHISTGHHDPSRTIQKFPYIEAICIGGPLYGLSKAVCPPLDCVYTTMEIHKNNAPLYLPKIFKR